MQIMLKLADKSNGMRPLSVSMPWLDCLLAEFFNQVRANSLDPLTLLMLILFFILTQYSFLTVYNIYIHCPLTVLAWNRSFFVRNHALFLL